MDQILAYHKASEDGTALESLLMDKRAIKTHNEFFIVTGGKPDKKEYDIITYEDEGLESFDL